ncbi:MAG: hypothetical protein CMO82_12675 [Winogradskyella sp.]|uniref:DUF3500 domain-containing protein n=1 Tax=Winogradskyella poriferorum TaxID=307627 RepID=A0ABU7W183_9FLAO|nr:hypothetical protein [Winogradskyella sp.]|tara:strand:+ start:7631 stop:8677 length:1047 start_codon:yes stop_codon:yes gene_type:complete
MKTLFSFILTFYSFIGFSQTSQEIVNISNEFLLTLSEDEKKEVLRDFNDSLRTKWTNLPIGLAKRPGKKFGDLSDEAKIKFHEVLTTIFSSQGYLKTTSIMQLDDMLNARVDEAIEKNLIKKENIPKIKALDWDYNNYFISIWGNPNLQIPWSIKFEGHHLSINLTIIKEKISFTPMFVGADPALIPSTKHVGLRVLSKEEDYGIKLINSFDESQQKIATLSQEVPKDIITNPSNNQRITEYQGIKANALTKDQKKILMLLIKEFINNLEYEKSNKYLLEIEEKGLDEIYFAWIGSYKKREPNYYIINGPNFIIEYDNTGNHIHSIWREKDNDFGEDLLRTHHINHKH